jgi:membrane-associated phospholipid phosphatase
MGNLIDSLHGPSAAILLPLLAALLVALAAWLAVRLGEWLLRNERRSWNAVRRLRPLLENVPGMRWLERRFPALLRVMRRRMSAGEYLAVHLIVGILVCVAALLGFMKIFLGVLGKTDLVAFDQYAARALYRAATPAGAELWGFVSHLGTYKVLGTAIALISLLLWRRGDRLFLPVSALGLIGASVLNAELKLMVRRARPFWEQPLATESTFSFPSGHSLGAVVGYGLAVYGIYLLTRHRRSWLTAAIVALILTLAIGYSRMYLGVHYFSDVLGGFAVGAFWLAITVTGHAVARRRGFLRERALRRVERSRQRRVA